MSSASAWYQQRDAEMVRRAGEGENTWVLAREHGISRTRVLQILREANPRQTDNQRIQRAREMAESLLARWDAGETYAQIAEDTGMSRWQVQSCISHGKWQRSSQANKYFWLRELAESEREHLRNLLYEGTGHQDWGPVWDAIHVLGHGVREATEAGNKRGGPVPPMPLRDALRDAIDDLAMACSSEDTTETQRERLNALLNRIPLSWEE